MSRWIVGCLSGAVALSALSGVTRAQVCIDGLCFVDRGAVTGEINLGMIRGGLAVLDYDNDGFVDLAIAGPNHLFRNVPDPDRPGQRTFLDVTAGSGLDDAVGAVAFSFGVVAADYDNDGDADLFMTGRTSSALQNGLLYRNDGGGFTNVTASSGLWPSDDAYESASWTDFDLDGFVDLALCRLTFGTGLLRLYRNQGDGTFVDLSDELLPTLPPMALAYSHMWMDYDGDGYADWFVPATSGPILLRNVADGAGGRRFANVTQEVRFTFLGPAPMGIAAGDYDNDGDFDIAVSDAVDGTYYENRNGRMSLVSPISTDFSWGLTWLDADNDGDLDHYQCGRYGGARFDSLVRNLGGGVFQNVDAALNGVNAGSQHSVQLDFNNDGRRDLITINPGSPPTVISVFENISTTGGNWLMLKLIGDGSRVNSDAIGAVARVTAGGVTRVRQVESGSSTTATEDLRVHFGLGSATVVDEIEVLWPGGEAIDERTDVYAGPFAVNQIVTLRPRDGACCLCAGGCTEASSVDCANLEGVWTARATCGDLVCDDVLVMAPDPPTPDPLGQARNRYLTFSPGNRGRRTAIRVTLEALDRPDPPGGSMGAARRFDAFEGEFRWVGPPAGFLPNPGAPMFETAARLQCQPHFTDWGVFDQVHVFGSEVIPSSTYIVEVVDGQCEARVDDGSAYSGSLTLRTARWGDVVDPFQPSCAESGCAPCNSNCRRQPDALDVVGVVGRFRGLPEAPPLVAAQIQGLTADPARLVNAIDIVSVIDAYRGSPFPYSGPISCPP